jgi:hypothetical protein
MNSLLVRGVNGERFSFEAETSDQILKYYSEITGIPNDFLWASQASRPFGLADKSLSVEVKLKILGGKGSFGSMLKGQGINAKVDNFESCRDLSGRRIRDINNQIRLKEWKEKQNEKIKESATAEVVIPVKRKKKISKDISDAIEKRTKSVQSAFAEGFKKAKFN